MLLADINHHAKRRFFAIPCGKRGKPNVVIPQIQRSLALRSFRAAEVADPNQMLGRSLGVSPPDPTMTPRQAAQALRDTNGGRGQDKGA